MSLLYSPTDAAPQFLYKLTPFKIFVNNYFFPQKLGIKEFLRYWISLVNLFGKRYFAIRLTSRLKTKPDFFAWNYLWYRFLVLLRTFGCRARLLFWHLLVLHLVPTIHGLRLGRFWVEKPAAIFPEKVHLLEEHSDFFTESRRNVAMKK